MPQQRYRALVSRLNEERVDGFLLPNIEDSGQPDTRYLTGFSGTTSWLLVTAKGERFLLVDARYHGRAKLEVKGCKIVAVPHGEKFSEALLRLAREKSVYRIGFDSSTTSVAVHHALWAAVSPLQLVALGEVMRRVRIIKDEEEIKLLAKAAKITTNAFNELLTKIRIGMTEEHVATLLEELFYEHSATGVAFPSIVASGVNGSLPHAQVSNKKLKLGELVTIDCGASYKGYMADMTRTIALGKESQLGAKARQLHQAVEASQRAGKGLLRAGMKAGDIDAMCRRALQKGGLEAYFTHSTGHGVGLAVHELPVVGPGSETALQQGMIVTVEPGVYLPKFGGVRIEDTFCITKDGAVNLTKGAPTKLQFITK